MDPRSGDGGVGKANRPQQNEVNPLSSAPTNAQEGAMGWVRGRGWGGSGSSTPDRLLPAEPREERSGRAFWRK